VLRDFFSLVSVNLALGGRRSRQSLVIENMHKGTALQSVMR